MTTVRESPGPRRVGRRNLRLCLPFIDALEVDGASISVFGLSGHQLTICTTDAMAARLESLQFELGEGPHWEVLRTGRSSLCDDLASAGPDGVPWPIFANSALKLDIGAVFAFPMMMGAAVIGAVDLYSVAPRHLDERHVSLGSSMAGRLAATAVRVATGMAGEAAPAETELRPPLRREVHQATGMIQAQLNTTASDAFARLRAHAFSSGQPVERIANQVVSRHLDFTTFTE